MGFLKDLLLGTPEQRKRKAKLKKKEREAYLKSYEKARIASAKKRGQQKGSQKPRSRLGAVGSFFEGGVEGAKSYMEMFDLDLGLEPKRKKKKKR